MTRRPLDCRHLVELLTRYLDGALTPSSRERVEDHLRRCADCEAHLRQLRLVIALAGRLGPPGVPARGAGGAARE